jgi:hypothetical protein
MANFQRLRASKFVATPQQPPEKKVEKVFLNRQKNARCIVSADIIYGISPDGL